jgi:hypothetical protein
MDKSLCSVSMRVWVQIPSTLGNSWTWMSWESEIDRLRVCWAAILAEKESFPLKGWFSLKAIRQKEMKKRQVLTCSGLLMFMHGLTNPMHLCACKHTCAHAHTHIKSHTYSMHTCTIKKLITHILYTIKLCQSVNHFLGFKILNIY